MTSKQGITAQWEVINKEKAANLLRFNERNRNANEKAIALLSKAIQEGKWRQNGDSIKIDKDGRLVDGQHRLKAIVKANAEVEILVVRNLAPEAITTYDQGKKRTLADVLKIEGYNRPLDLAKVGLALNPNNLVKDLHYTNTSAMGVVMGDMVEYVAENEDYFLTLYELYKTHKKASPKIVLGGRDYCRILHLISGGAVKQKHVEFMAHLSGAIRIPNTSAAWVYEKMLYHSDRKTSVSSKWVQAMGVKSWNNFINGNPPVRNLAYNENNPFPKAEKYVL